MTRLYGALHRATEGKAQILPPGAGIAAGQDTDSSQPAFSVPWSLDALPPVGDEEKASAEPAAFSSRPTTHVERGLPEIGEKLVGVAASEEQASLAVAIEQYRKLAATLHHAQTDRRLKLIMVTSANPGEGKSLTASNLALTLSSSYQRRVLLIDGDLRRPSLHDIFGVPNRTGLSDGLARDSVQGLAVLEVSTRLSFLPSGEPMEDPTGALTSHQMRRILDEARARYDWVVIDTPPIGLLSDAKLLADMVDGVVLVVEAGKSQYPDLLRAIDSIGRERLVGAVLNRLQNMPGSSKYYASYYRRSYAPNA
jgi:capsular exopolysaccharide synthesis family protein